MNRYERLNALLELVVERGKVDIELAAAELEVSGATVRRDLDHLASQHLIERTHGGAVALNVALDLPVRYRTRSLEKQRIGRAASALVQPGMVVGLNGGTTTTEVARALATEPSLHAVGPEPALTIVTNALNIASELTVRPHVKILVTGGVARSQSYEMIGPLATRLLDDLTLDIVFIGVDAIDVRHGACAQHEGEAITNQALVRSSRQVVVVADSSKLGRHAFARICPVSDVDVLVTESNGAEDFIREFEQAGVKVIKS